MKTKVLSGILLAGGLLASGAAQSALVLDWTSTMTVAAWALLPGVGDGDGDTTFTYSSTSGGAFGTGTNVTFSEWEDSVTNADYYRVEFENTGGLGTGSIVYGITTTDPVGFNWAEVDTSHIASGLGTKELDDAVSIASPFLTLTSTNGSSQEGVFTGRQSFFVRDTVVTPTLTNFIDNYQFVPEPMSLSLFGIGLAALRFGRRRTA